MHIQPEDEFQNRRNFLKKTVYITPALISLGALEAKASQDGTSYSGKSNSTLHTSSSGLSSEDESHKEDVNHENEETHGGSEKDIDDDSDDNNNDN